jgi:hypothetical protein
MKTNNTISCLTKKVLLNYKGTVIWFTCIIIGISIALSIASNHWYWIDGAVNGTTSILIDAPRTFMFILGILSTGISFILYVEAGVTRQNSFWANTAAFLILSFGILLAGMIVNAVLSLFYGFTSPVSFPVLLIKGFTCMLYYYGGWLISLLIYNYGAKLWLPAVAAGGAVIVLTEYSIGAFQSLPEIFTILILLAILVAVAFLMKYIVSKINVKM